MLRYSKQLFVSILFVSISLGSFASLSVGSQAPNFILSDQNNISHDLSDYKGSWVILYFYPKDDTPGCTTQACDFRDAVERIIASRSTVFGVSLDSVESHKRFAEKLCRWRLHETQHPLHDHLSVLQRTPNWQARCAQQRLQLAAKLVAPRLHAAALGPVLLRTNGLIGRDTTPWL